MNYLNIIAKTPLSLQAIFDARKTPLWITFIFYLMINIGFTFPFVFGFITLEQVSSERFFAPEVLLELDAEGTLDFLREMSILEDLLTDHGDVLYKEVTLGNSKILFDYEDTYVPLQGEMPYVARLTKGYMEITMGMTVYSDYTSFPEEDFSTMSSGELLDYFLVNALRSSIRQWIFPVFAVFYLAFLAINTFFIFGVSIIAIIFRFGDQVKLTYKETLNVVVYASVLPVILSVIITMAFNLLGINMLIYNFGTFAMYLLVRRQFMKPISKGMVG